MAHKVWVDTNVIISFLTKDSNGIEAAQLMEKVQSGEVTLKVPSIVIAECCWVLEGPRFGYTPSDIATTLTHLIYADGIEVDEKSVILESLQNYAAHGIDFTDAYMAAHSRANPPDHVATFNIKDFQKLGITVSRPKDI
ncbi:PIN domain-containing protein [Effusibacillus dendaii]|uniref:PIN domain-containing protein n=1 Tax=Effusibacillus dendaii TaxID=2743772 RepID=A0A7I8DIU3_9BACL|nr:PIN domain-containing protein [Effusibacillus dendaii]BCJ87761.1 hypothetical protein skT53_27460 [Effusibacillus dendaii]